MRAVRCTGAGNYEQVAALIDGHDYNEPPWGGVRTTGDVYCEPGTFFPTSDKPPAFDSTYITDWVYNHFSDDVNNYLLNNAADYIGKRCFERPSKLDFIQVDTTNHQILLIFYDYTLGCWIIDDTNPIYYMISARMPPRSYPELRDLVQQSNAMDNIRAVARGHVIDDFSSATRSCKLITNY